MAPLFPQRASTEPFLERIYRPHVGDVYDYALAVLSDESDAEDVTQTTFMNAYRAFAGGDRPERTKNWLIAIAHNLCRRRSDEPLLDEETAEDGAASRADDIRRALARLPRQQRSLLVLRLEGRPYGEIASILGLTGPAVETLAFRARRALREQLDAAAVCREAEVALARAEDGELAWSDRRTLAAHLRSCAECSQLARRQRAQATALRELPAAALPSSLAGR